MAWNEPGNNGNDNDPWGGGRRGGDQGPPNIDEVIKNLTKKFNNLFGGSGNSGSGNSGGSTSCLLYTSPSPRDATLSRMPSSA